MTFALTFVADVLRAAGLGVVEIDGWQSRGRGEMGRVNGVICHHTAGPLKGDTPSLSLIEHGRPDLAGPLSQLFLSRSGNFYAIAAGRCNHAGRGAWHGVTDGNAEMIGIEAENAGTPADPWPAVQLDAYARGVAAILMHIGADSVMCAGHKEYALPRGRKIDPSFDMVDFRSRVAGIMALQNGDTGPIATVDPRRAMLRKGDQGHSVVELQRRLGVRTPDGLFGPETEAAVKAFQSKHGLAADGLVGPATWNALGFFAC